MTNDSETLRQLIRRLDDLTSNLDGLPERLSDEGVLTEQDWQTMLDVAPRLEFIGRTGLRITQHPEWS